MRSAVTFVQLHVFALPHATVNILDEIINGLLLFTFLSDVIIESLRKLHKIRKILMSFATDK